MPARSAADLRVPLLDLTAQYGRIRDEVRAAIDRVCDAQQFILGPEVAALEQEVAEHAAAAAGVGVSSGTDALLIALMDLGVGPGDEVVTTPYSFFATAGAVARLGARAVFVDIEPGSCNLRADLAVEALTPRTKAVIPVHLYGRMAELTPILEAARARGVAVIEDAAQAIGAFDGQGRRAGGAGDYGCFSFFPSKNLGGFGDGGLVTARDPETAERLRVLRVHGSKPKYYHHVVGGNFRLDALQAAVLRVKLRYLGEWTERRRANAARYRAMLAEADLLGRVTPPAEEPGMVYNQFVIRAERRDELQRHLAECGIGTEVYYPVPLHLQACFRDWGYGPGDFPEAERAARETLALPIYAELEEAQQARVVACMREFYSR